MCSWKFDHTRSMPIYVITRNSEVNASELLHNDHSNNIAKHFYHFTMYYFINSNNIYYTTTYIDMYVAFVKKNLKKIFPFIYTTVCVIQY